MLCDIGQVLVDLAVQCHDPVHVVVGACEDCGAAGRTDRVGHVAVVEFHPIVVKPVDVGGVVDVGVVGADGFGGVVVGHYEEDVGAGCGRHGG